MNQPLSGGQTALDPILCPISVTNSEWSYRYLETVAFAPSRRWAYNEHVLV
jgi:hypothetical protein